MIYDALCLLLVGFLWGATNPFIRLGSKGIDSIKAEHAVQKFFKELWFLATSWKYVLPFLLNQSGSLLYVLTLQNTSLSIAVPVANAFSFVFTAISAHFLGESKSSKNVYLGTVLVIGGSIFCLLGNLKEQVR